MNFFNAAGLHACREAPQVTLSFPYSKKLLFSAVKVGWKKNSKQPKKQVSGSICGTRTSLRRNPKISNVKG